MLALLVFLIITAVHLTCLGAGADTAADITQVMLMPALALTFWALLRGRVRSGRQQRLVHLVGWGLFFSWLGDSIPRLLDGDPAFGVLIGCFLLAQVAYIRAFWPWSPRSVLHRRRLLVPYVATAAVLVGLCLPGAGILAPAVLLYGATLALMGVLATGLTSLTWAGGVIFMLSDSLIALDAFDVWSQPGHDLWVMGTYTVAQLFLVLGVVKISSGDDDQQHAGVPPHPGSGMAY